MPLPENPLALLLELADPATVREALEVARKKLELTPLKLGLLIARMLNPMQDFGEEEEAELRGMTRKTLAKQKGEMLLPSSPQVSVIEVKSKT